MNFIFIYDAVESVRIKRYLLIKYVQIPAAIRRKAWKTTVKKSH